MNTIPSGCTLVGLRCTDGRWIIGSNSDDPWKTRTKLINVKSNDYQYIGTELVCEGDQNVPWAGMITRGLNKHGFCFTYAHVEPTDGNWNSRPGVNFHDFSVHILCECSTVSEAIKYIKDAERAFHGNFIMNDINQDIVLLEVTTKELNIVRPNEWEWPLPMICCNYYVSKRMRFYTDLEYTMKSNAPSRWHNAMLTAQKSNAQGMQLMRTILSSHEGRLKKEGSWGSCPCNHGTEVGTVSSEIIDAEYGIFYYCLGWPCGCRDTLPSQDYQHMSWGDFKQFKLTDYDKSVVLVDCQRGINITF